MYSSIRPLLFRLEAERAHTLTLNAVRLAGKIRPVRWLLARLLRAPARPLQAFGLTFKNPVGLAAGYDKDGIAIHGLGALGFGHIEIGTVTPRPQPGNPRPRLFRLIEDEAVINCMGFPSRGSEFVQGQLNPYLLESGLERYFGFVPPSRKSMKRMIEKGGLILGINLGRNKDTSNEEAALDYISLVDSFAPYADYLTINISSPNTPGLRQLQEAHALEGLLTHIHQQRIVSQKTHDKRLPILVKLSPDLTDPELTQAVEAVLRTNMDGLIVTNTTLAREGLSSRHQRESGGLSGRPLKGRSEALLSRTLDLVQGQVAIVSVGGIMQPEDAKRRLDMGAALVQLYSGLVYRGPALVRQILLSL